MEVVPLIDPVDEDDPGLGIGVGGPHDAVEQLASRDHAVGGAAERKLPGRVLLDRLHEGVGDQYREVEHAQALGVLLGRNEVLDVRMVAAQGAHHGAPARAGAHDGAAHGVPDVHETQRAGGVRPHPVDHGALGPEGREVVADAPALLQGERRLLEVLENAAHVVRDAAHDKTVEQRHPAVGPRPGENPAGRNEAEIRQRLGKAAGP